MTFSNELTTAEIERLALLLEELGEVQQVVGKILRHGYASYDPRLDNPQDRCHPTNRELLERELGDVRAAMELMLHEADVVNRNINHAMYDKLERVQRYLHHQPPVMFAFLRQRTDGEPA